MTGQPINDALSHQRLIEELDALARRYRRLIDQMKVVVLTVNQIGIIKFINRAWAIELGYPVIESLEIPIFAYLHPDDVVKAALVLGVASDCQCFPGGGEVEVRFISRSGETVWMAMLLPSMQGDERCATVSLVNITERKRVDQTLRESESRWGSERLVQDRSPVAKGIVPIVVARLRAKANLVKECR